MTSEELEREHLVRLGSEDWYLARDDAAVVCQAIALSMPPLSWEAIKARICSVICRVSRDGDRWMSTGSRENQARPISPAAVSFLKANASKDVLGTLEVTYDVFVKQSSPNGQQWLTVEELYGLIGRGLQADSFRAWMAKKAKNSGAGQVVASAQRSAFGQD